jgi:hypothetical protein
LAGYDLNLFVVVAVFGLMLILLPFLIRGGNMGQLSSVFSLFGALLMIYLFVGVGAAGGVATNYNAGVGNSLPTTEIIMIPVFLCVVGFLVTVLKLAGKV